jgi:hypothetical protein
MWPVPLYFVTNFIIKDIYMKGVKNRGTVPEEGC